MHSRELWFAVGALVLMALPGCTSLRLQHSIASQAKTLTDLHYQQVLNNLAMFSVNPYLLPAHVTVRDGSAQIQDFGSLGAMAALGWTDKAHAWTGTPSVSASRTVVEQWGVSPVADGLELRILQIAYQRAVGIPVLMDADLLNDLAREVSKQTAETSDIDQRNEYAAFNQYRDKVAELYAQAWFPVMRKESLSSFLDDYNLGLKTAGQFDSNALVQFIGTNQDKIILDEEYAADATLASLSLAYYPPPGVSVAPGAKEYFFTPLAQAARKEVKDVQRVLGEIGPGWFHTGTRHDVPKHACYVGRYKDRYAWVCPQDIAALSRFTIAVLDFSDLIKERAVFTVPGGPRFTPSGGR
jgi:hypothetical protein